MSAHLESMALNTQNGLAWHKLGKHVDADASIDEWRKTAGLDWRAESSKIYYKGSSNDALALYTLEGKRVIFRSDTKAALGLVSDLYQVVQPATVLEFFRELVRSQGYKMETAGALFGGKRIWAMAKAGEHEEVLPGDKVLPYLLMATSFDGTFATLAKMTSVRVVCNNTLTLAAMGCGVEYKVIHLNQFSIEKAQAALGLTAGKFDQMMERLKDYAHLGLAEREVDSILLQFIDPQEEKQDDKVRETKVYQRIKKLWRGDVIGYSGKGTAYDLLNSATQYFDYESGRGANRGAGVVLALNEQVKKEFIQSIEKEIAR